MPAPRMLIVDDDPGMRTTLRRIMSAKGYVVSAAASGEAAIQLAEVTHPDVLLLDMRMPGLNGVETYQQIKSICPKAIAIFMTAFSSSDLSKAAIAEGAVKVMSKPIDFDELFQLIEHASKSRPLLVIDDDPGFRESLKRALVGSGFHVYTAAGMDDALAEFKKHPRCMVLLDMKLEGATGLEVLAQIRTIDCEAIVFLMSAFSETESSMTYGVESGACCSFHKPFDIQKLVSAIELCS